MSNTLILTFAGGSLSELILNYAYDLPYLQLINSYTIGIEMMQGITGSIGIILTVPLISLFAVVLAGTPITYNQQHYSFALNLAKAFTYAFLFCFLFI